MQVHSQMRGGTGQVNIDGVPDHCPVCLKGIQPIETNQRYAEAGWLESVLRCPRFDCQRFFIARYALVAGTGATFTFQESVPLTIAGTTTLSETIKKISPDFVAIYKDADEAEQRNLKLVCGPGYRKALEFFNKRLCHHTASGAE